MSFSGKKRSGDTGQDFADVEFYWHASTKSCTVHTLLLLGLRCLFGSVIFYSRSSSKPTDHTTIHFYTNSPCGNGNAIISTGRKTGSLGFFQGFAVIYNVTILTFVPLSHCSENKVFQQFHEGTAPLQAQCKERHSWAFLGKLNRQRQSRNLSVPHGK